MNRDTVKKTARATSDWAVEGRREKPYDAVDHLVFPLRRPIPIVSNCN